jgi:hypothetical protein
MTSLPFVVDFPNPRCVLLDIPGRRVWDQKANGAGGWIDRPASGTTPPSCIWTPDHFCDTGGSSCLWCWNATIDPADLVGASLAIVTLDAAGNVSKYVDLWPTPYLRDYYVVRGGWVGFC